MKLFLRPSHSRVSSQLKCIKNVIWFLGYFSIEAQFPCPRKSTISPFPKLHVLLVCFFCLNYSTEEFCLWDWLHAQSKVVSIISNVLDSNNAVINRREALNCFFGFCFHPCWRTLILLQNYQTLLCLSSRGSVLYWHKRSETDGQITTARVQTVSFVTGEIWI